MLTLLRDNDRYNEQVKPNTAFLNELKEKLPEFFTKDGSFDMDKFKTQLKDKNINELSEGYQLDFIGKDYARRQAGEMPGTVIVPDKEQNHGEGKESKNLFFTGDNLEVLRHLQNNYQNKIDVIYIDPPYNTGSDGFVYPDSFEYSDDKLKEMFGLSDDQVERLKSIQGKSSHSAWLTFMYPRLVLAKRILSKDGTFFMSIDDNEVANAKECLDEIFGESNFVGFFSWNKSQNPPSLSKTIRHKLEYVICYSFNLTNSARFFGGMIEGGDSPLYNGGNDESILEFPRNSVIFNIEDGTYKPLSSEKISLLNTVIVKNKINQNSFKLKGKFRWKQKSLVTEIRQGTKILIKSKSFTPRYARENKRYMIPSDFIGASEKVGTNEYGRKEVENLLGEGVFSFPKPTSLIKYLINMVGYTKKKLRVLDFFAGSSTTADAVMQLNAEDCGHRKFIMVQLPEKTYQTNKDGKEVPTKGGKAAYDAGFKSIDEISRERIRRAAKKIKEDNELTLPEDFDGSFKHYRVVNPTKQTLEDIDNFDPNNTNLFTNMVDSFSSKSLNVAGDASGEQTILTTWLAQDGYAFDTEVEDKQFGNYHAHLVDDRLYLINEGWSSDQTKELLNQLGKNELHLQSIVLFGYSFNIAELRELESGLKQLDSKVTLIKRY